MHTPDLPEKEKNILVLLEKDVLCARVQQLVSAGWTLQSIANAFSPPRRRSTIRSWAVRHVSVDISHLPEVTPPPVKKKPERRQRPASPGIPVNEQLQIARLSPLARRYRARTHPSSSSFSANKELSHIARELYLRGVTVSELARASGVTYRAMKRRVDKALSS
jgi:hypothetical protein